MTVLVGFYFIVCTIYLEQVWKFNNYLRTGNSVIAVNGDENVDLENNQLYKKASRPSVTYPGRAF